MFIVFEGIDGCGKSTQVELLQTAFVNKQIEAKFTREPGGTPFAEELRKSVLTNQVDPKVALLAMFAARYDHISKVIVPNLMKRRHVVCSRYVGSTFAYQVRDSPELVDLAITLASSAPKPDLTILLDLDAETARSRMQGRELDVFETKPIEWHEQTRELFKLQVNKSYLVVDATQSANDIHNQILERLRSHGIAI